MPDYRSTHALARGLYDDPRESDRSLSARLDIARTTVRSIRAQLVQRGDIPATFERRQADGTWRVVPRRGDA